MDILELLNTENTGILSEFLNRGYDINAPIEKWGLPALLYSIRTKGKPFLKFLVSKGADVHAKDRWGWNALHHAVAGNNLEAIKFLIKSGINPHAETEIGKTAFTMACFYNYPEIVEYLAQFKL